MNQMAHDIKVELKSLIEENNHRLVEFLEKNIKSKTINLSDFDDIIEGKFLNDLDYFMYFYYPIIHELIMNFFPVEQIYEKERKFFQKYSLFEGESILTVFE